MSCPTGSSCLLAPRRILQTPLCYPVRVQRRAVELDPTLQAMSLLCMAHRQMVLLWAIKYVEWSVEEWMK